MWSSFDLIATMSLERGHFTEFKDWRNKAQEKTQNDTEASKNKYSGKRYQDYITEQIREAEARGEFDNLPGFGKPLQLNSNPYAGENAMGYNLLKSNGYAPKEIELAREITGELKRAEARVAALRQRGQALRTRRVPPFPSEKRAYNAAVEKAIVSYERTLRDLNPKILTLNLSAPAPMHRSMLEVEQLVQQFREFCPLFT